MGKYQKALEGAAGLAAMFHGILPSMEALKEAADAEKWLEGFQKEKQTLAKGLEDSIKSLLDQERKAKQQLDSITPTLEARRRESNEEVVRLQTRQSEQEHAMGTRMASTRQDMLNQQNVLQGEITAKKQELADVNAKVEAARQQHAAFLSSVGGVAR